MSFFCIFAQSRNIITNSAIKQTNMKTEQPFCLQVAIVGGGAAGFFTAIRLKEIMGSHVRVTILESGERVLRKVEISGGGRCNCTNSFALVTDLQQVYPRGHRLMKRLMKGFSQKDAYEWFEQHGVKLTTQEDECVFPQTQDSHTIINMFLHEAQRLEIEIKTKQKITSIDTLKDFDCIVIAIGGNPREESIKWLLHEIVTPIPSLFTFTINDLQLHELMGTVAEHATAMLPGTKMRSEGPLLVTHWGMSGPCILRLSSYAARLLAEHNYQMPLSINWTSHTEAEMHNELLDITIRDTQKMVMTIKPFDITQRLWSYLVQKSLGNERCNCRWGELSKKELNRLTNNLINDTYQIAGRAPFKDEFVTCGGISLSAIDASTLESKSIPGLYFTGEILDIDGVTGGFNFQAAWTTANTVAEAISRKIQ